MGSHSGKMVSNPGYLSRTETQMLTDFLGNSLTPDILNSKWKTLATNRLLTMYVDYINKNCRTNGSEISIKNVATFYSAFTHGTMEEKAEFIRRIVGATEADNASFSSIVVYVGDVIRSYLKVQSKQQTSEYQSWSKVHCSTTEDKVHEVARCWCVDMYKPNGKVSTTGLENWLRQCFIFVRIQSYMLNALFGQGHPDGQSNIPLCVASHAPATILDMAQVIFLNALLPTAFQQRWRFLFSTRSHGESFSRLLGAIVNQGPTIVIVYDVGKSLFGGFAPHSWRLGPKYFGDDTCFLFMLTPRTSHFLPTGYNDHFQYLNTGQHSMPNGLGMGGQLDYWGLWLDAEFGNGRTSEMCTTFRDYKMLSTTKEFRISQLEVWGVGEPPAADEERKDKSILDKDGAATAMLEMVGRKQHSQGLREPVNE